MIVQRQSRHLLNRRNLVQVEMGTRRKLISSIPLPASLPFLQKMRCPDCRVSLGSCPRVPNLDNMALSFFHFQKKLCNDVFQRVQPAGSRVFRDGLEHSTYTNRQISNCDVTLRSADLMIAVYINRKILRHIMGKLAHPT